MSFDIKIDIVYWYLINLEQMMQFVSLDRSHSSFFCECKIPSHMLYLQYAYC